MQVRIPSRRQEAVAAQVLYQDCVVIFLARERFVILLVRYRQKRCDERLADIRCGLGVPLHLLLTPDLTHVGQTFHADSTDRFSSFLSIGSYNRLVVVFLLHIKNYTF